MNITTEHSDGKYKVLVDGILVAFTDNERELAGLVRYYENKYRQLESKGAEQ